MTEVGTVTVLKPVGLRAPAFCSIGRGTKSPDWGDARGTALIKPLGKKKCHGRNPKRIKPLRTSLLCLNIYLNMNLPPSPPNLNLSLFFRVDFHVRACVHVSQPLPLAVTAPLSITHMHSRSPTPTLVHAPAHTHCQTSDQTVEFR